MGKATAQAAKYLACLCLAMWSNAALLAQTYPTKPIRVVIPYPPGGGADILFRPIAQQMMESLAQSVLIDNRPGANGNIGTDLVAKAPPDGYTLLLGTVSNLAISPSVYKQLPYDPIKDFAPVTLVASTSAVLVVHPSLPVRTLKELIRFSRGVPDGLSYASSGVGSTNHLTTEMFKSLTGARLVHVPYKGAPQAINDLVTGRISVMFMNAPVVLPHVKSGKLRPLAVTSASRSPLFPNVPSVAESGYRGFDVAATWYGLMAPAGTRREIVERLNQAVSATLRNAGMRERLVRLGLDPIGNSAADYTAFLKAEIEKWGKVVKIAGIIPE